jgi:release factor glutamine methyltransferase
MPSFQISHALKQARSRYPEIPALEIRLLLQHLLKVDRAWLISHENNVLEASIHAEFQALLKRRSSGEPLAYIVGYREFYGLKLKVTPDTLIPRADTETLVEAALEKTGKQKCCRILDLGTGSGAIALAVARHRPQAHVLAVDVSEKALNVAYENAQMQNINNITFLQSDWFDALKGELFDVMVSNPPYIEENDPHLHQADLRFEPITALVSGKDGLKDLQVIIDSAKDHLKPYGWLMLEHGYNQARAVANLMREAGFAEVAHKYDLAGIERVTLGQWQ